MGATAEITRLEEAMEEASWDHGYGSQEYLRAYDELHAEVYKEMGLPAPPKLAEQAE